MIPEYKRRQNFGNWLQGELHRLQLSRRALAVGTEESVTKVNRILHGQTGYSLAFCIRTARFLSCPLDTVLAQTGDAAVPHGAAAQADFFELFTTLLPAEQTLVLNYAPVLKLALAEYAHLPELFAEMLPAQRAQWLALGQELVATQAK